MHKIYSRPRSTQGIRTLRHIATGQTIPGMRSCPSHARPQRQIQDQARMISGYAQMQIREQQRRQSLLRLSSC
ncbi:MAG: hypothetical protein AAFU71_06760 [Cyanobacteria bacterium J06632_22]